MQSSIFCENFNEKPKLFLLHVFFRLAIRKLKNENKNLAINTE